MSCVDSIMGRRKKKPQNGSLKTVKIYVGPIPYGRVGVAKQRKRIRKLLMNHERHKPVIDAGKISKLCFHDRQMRHNRRGPDTVGCAHLI